jgi:uncharacterized membrane protein YbaN (DUF454 family)
VFKETTSKMNSSQQIFASKKSKKQRVIRALLLVAGTISLTLGAIGIILPILPTTPFLLLSAACYLRSSESMHKWLLGNRWFGEYIKNYQAGRGIPLKTKILAMTVLWGSIIFSAFFVLDEILIMQVAMLLIALGVSVHLIRLPTLKK